MDALITFNDSLNTLGMPVSINGVDFQLSGNRVLGLLLLFFASYFQRLSVTGIGSWNTANEVIGPSLDSSPPPIITARNGCFGLLSILVTKPLVWIFFVAGIDQLIWEGGMLTLLK